MGLRLNGVVRNIDSFGRIVIPKEVRKANGWETGTAMEMHFEKDALVIREYKQGKGKEELLNNIYEIINKLGDNEDITVKELKELADRVKDL